MKFILFQISAYCRQELTKVCFDGKRVGKLKHKLILKPDNSENFFYVLYRSLSILEFQR